MSEHPRPETQLGPLGIEEVSSRLPLAPATGAVISAIDPRPTPTSSTWARVSTSWRPTAHRNPWLPTRCRRGDDVVRRRLTMAAARRHRADRRVRSRTAARRPDRCRSTGPRHRRPSCSSTAVDGAVPTARRWRRRGATPPDAPPTHGAAPPNGGSVPDPEFGPRATTPATVIRRTTTPRRYGAGVRHRRGLRPPWPSSGFAVESATSSPDTFDIDASEELWSSSPITDSRRLRLAAGLPGGPETQGYRAPVSWDAVDARPRARILLVISDDIGTPGLAASGRHRHGCAAPVAGRAVRTGRSTPSLHPSRPPVGTTVRSTSAGVIVRPSAVGGRPLTVSAAGHALPALGPV